jgi:hypothetical protein
MTKYISGLLLLGSIFFSGCYYDVESELYPINPAKTCDTVNVSYQARIEPIIRTNCYVCHGGTAVAGGNIMLEGYTNLKNFDGARLYGAVSHTSGSQMPKGGTKLPECDIKAIKAWIDTGKPQ